MLRSVTATRYVSPLREGGSLPAIIEADDDGLYVLKFRAAGQGVKALIAELIGGEAARAAGIRMPELVFVELDAVLGRNEPDYEIRELLVKSAGQNLALDYLPGSISYDPLGSAKVDPLLASKIVWLDAFLMNVDRTARNANMLMWHKNLWLIDHGAALYFHHDWPSYSQKVSSPFSMIRDHVLLGSATELEVADREMRRVLTEEKLREIVGVIPDSWLEVEGAFTSPDAIRDAYISFLSERVSKSNIFITEAVNARANLT